MSDLIVPTRRGFITGMAALVAAPAIVRIESLMPMRSLVPAIPLARGNTLLSLNQITREAVRLWKNSNAFIHQLDDEYDAAFAPVVGATSLFKKL